LDDKVSIDPWTGKRRPVIRLCDCGSGEDRYELKDGYGIFLTYACEKCEKRKLAGYRSNIMDRYDHDEPLDEE
jgi:hypothetical protein